MKVFLDTNVILDFYDIDRGHYQPAAIVFDLASKGEIEVSVCALSFVTAFFLLHSKYDKSMLYEKMRALFKLCHVTAVDMQIVTQGDRPPKRNRSCGAIYSRIVHQQRTIYKRALFLCKDRDSKTVEFAFRDINKPMGVATYRTSSELPKEYEGILPEPEELRKLM